VPEVLVERRAAADRPGRLPAERLAQPRVDQGVEQRVPQPQPDARPLAGVRQAQGDDPGQDVRQRQEEQAARVVRAENLIHGCDQQRCPPRRPAVMITGHVPAVRLPPDHADDLWT